ncbi:hypothetical protein [uncultured Pelagimonas sp.]|uniref:hypothetical protein n=1 Tax=uncultured Pelagimonas sp. TaxID=1618102 RepID=UPI0026251E2F|nr:hypothetical protein [uncultured Pelagimonas sp.]
MTKHDWMLGVLKDLTDYAQTNYLHEDVLLSLEHAARQFQQHLPTAEIADCHNVIDFDARH